MSHFTEDNTYIVHGPKSKIPISDRSIGFDIYKAFTQLPKDFTVLIDGFTGEKLSIKDLSQRTVNLATALRVLGYSGQKTFLSVCSENSLDFFVPVLAALLNLSVVATLNHLYTYREFDHCLRLSQSRIVFCSEATLSKFVEAKRSLGFIERIILLDKVSGARQFGSDSGIQTLDQLIEEALNGVDVNVETFVPLNGPPHELDATILCSSGTTGLPKGVILTHGNLNLKLTHSRDPMYQLQTDNTTIVVIPFFHGFGFMITLFAIANGQRIVFLRKFDEHVFLQCIEKYKISILPLAPPLVVWLSKTSKLNQYDLSSVKDILCGAAPLSKDSEDVVKRRLKSSIRQGYGLTEATFAVAILSPGQNRPGSCGKILSEISAKVRDPDTGRCLGPNRVGELCLKGDVIMKCYYRNEQATKDTFTADGWLKTGDLGYFDDEGFLFIVDRLKELIKYKGFQVAPAELEAILINHPKINEAGVVGLPDELVGERPVAFVSLKEGVDATEKEIVQYVANLVSPQKRLTGGVIFVETIPKNPSGKILRRELREMLKNHDATRFKAKL